MAEETPVNDRLRDDEIDLYQLWEILVRRKKWILICTAFCVLVACLYVFLKVPVYKYTTTIEPGSIYRKNDIGVVVREEFSSAEDLSVVLENSLIPKTAAEFEQEDKKSFAIKLTTPRNSRYLLLTTQETSDSLDAVKAFHLQVNNRLLLESQLVTEPAREVLQVEIAQAKLRLDKLENPSYYKVLERELTTRLLQTEQEMAALVDREKFLNEKDRHLATTKKLIEDQLTQSEKVAADSRKRFPLAVNEAGDEAKAMTMLMLSSQMQQEQNRISSLKERLNVSLEKEKQELLLQKENLERERVLQKEQIAQVKDQLSRFKLDFASQLQEEKNRIAAAENRLSTISDIRVVGLAVQSLDPVGPGKKVVLALLLILGLMGGVILAFFVEFIASPRQRQV